jgi:hypothetical protein
MNIGLCPKCSALIPVEDSYCMTCEALKENQALKARVEELEAAIERHGTTIRLAFAQDIEQKARIKTLRARVAELEKELRLSIKGTEAEYQALLAARARNEALERAIQYMAFRTACEWCADNMKVRDDALDELDAKEKDDGRD